MVTVSSDKLGTTLSFHSGSLLTAGASGSSPSPCARIPIEWSVAMALASLAPCHSVQHARCAQAWPIVSVPKGSNGSQGRSPPPQAWHRPGADGVGLRLIHSVKQ